MMKLKIGIQKYGIRVIVPLLFVVMSACSETEFSVTEFSETDYTVNVGQVDILFVVDNSGSMSTEHRRMAQSFPNFVQGLDLAGLDYRIGMVTTDVVSRYNKQINGGSLQNGNLIQFANGEYYLTPESKNIEYVFQQTVQRPETIRCENSGFNSDTCPSDDERGVYAAYLTVNANKKDFFRKNGHVAFVFLSDEDERGFGISKEQYPYKMPEALDYPENLLNIVTNKLGANTEISAHAIVTDSASCQEMQRGQANNQYIHGSIGTFYMSMINPDAPALINNTQTVGSYAKNQLVQGTIGSICSSDYVSELGSIKSVLSKTKSSERLKCKIFDEEKLKIRLDSNYNWRLSEDKLNILFTPPLPPGKSFKIQYECP